MLQVSSLPLFEMAPSDVKFKYKIEKLKKLENKNQTCSELKLPLPICSSCWNPTMDTLQQKHNSWNFSFHFTFSIIAAPKQNLSPQNTA